MRFVRFSLAGLLALALTACHSNSSSETAKAPAATSAAPAVGPKPGATSGKKRLLFFGNSLTAGYGVEPDQAFPGLIGQKIDSLQLDYEVVNAGLSGETTAGGLSRVGWVLRQPVAVFVLELGGNDGLRGLPLASTRRNLQGIIDTVRRRSPKAQIVLAGMQIPPNLGAKYAADFKAIYQDLATQNNLVLIPFLLQGVGGDRSLNQADGIHPTPAGHRIVARTVWTVLQPLLPNYITRRPSRFTSSRSSSRLR
ncbi:arylesterase [Hymenobacter ruricola]|uniref:Arylesterase n=1 Tax=Hymenobacter ruricola TaxID=2791023 RepID=A0ABS0I1X4_9BACT|nr:arylesterase [Hymenobacter ruricola]MBF9220953.1 arylesterase [Hymenobacter ruricola]